MGKKLIINLTRLTQHPAVIHTDGLLDSIQVMPQGRCELREGSVVCPRWLGANPKTIKVYEVDALALPKGVVVAKVEKPLALAAVEPAEGVDPNEGKSPLAAVEPEASTAPAVSTDKEGE